jgi:hypothetical protein
LTLVLLATVVAHQRQAAHGVAQPTSLTQSLQLAVAAVVIMTTMVAVVAVRGSVRLVVLRFRTTSQTPRLARTVAIAPQALMAAAVVVSVVLVATVQAQQAAQVAMVKTFLRGLVTELPSLLPLVVAAVVLVLAVRQAQVVLLV